VELNSDSVGTCARQPLPPTVQVSELQRQKNGALKAREKRRINNLPIMQFDSRDFELINKMQLTVHVFSVALGLDVRLTVREIRDALEQAHIAADGHYTLKHAEQWNSDFEFPQSAIDADTELWHQCSQDLTATCKAKQARLAHNRLSVQRVRQVFGNSGTKYPGMLQSDFQLLLDFAANGITPLLADDFVPQSTNKPPLRARYLTLKHTVNCLLYKQHTDGTVLLFRTKDVEGMKDVHFSPQHQADSKGKQEGRVIGDLSGQHDPFYTPLNGTASSKPALRALISSTWGEIKHPTVDQLVLMVLTATDIHGWANVILWKKDLKGAFNLLNYNPAYCRLFTFLLSDDITMIHLAGLFGWIGMPHAFQVLTRSLQAMCTYIITGLCHWYVDDLMAVSPTISYQKDSDIVDEKVQSLLGHGSVAANKSFHARKLEFLGWIFDLDTKSITLCDRNLYKLIHALFSLTPQEKVSIAHIQRIASLTSRASMLNSHMRSYTHELHIITSGYTKPHVRISLSLLAQSDIMMWRSFALILISEPTKLSRSMESFRPRDPQYCFKYDASLERIAVGVYLIDDDRLVTFAATDLPFVVNNEARRQNTMEFIAIVFGLLLCWRIGIAHFHYDLHGDSKSSLAWAKNSRVNSIIARRSNIVFTTLSMHLDSHVATTQHIPGKLNTVFDGLSRHKTASEVGLDDCLMYDADSDRVIIEFLQLCDPDYLIDTLNSHITLLCRCQTLLSPAPVLTVVK